MSFSAIKIIEEQTPMQIPIEEACSFGGESKLVGVYTPPALRDESEICAIYITAGLVHHIGPTRLHVELARELSNDQIAGLRFDLSGIGDSETSALGGYFTERSVAEVCSAMDFIQQRYHYNKFVLIGLCSGADDALATAQMDPRVNGVVLLNGYAYPAGRFKLHQIKELYVPRLLNIDKWKIKLDKMIFNRNKTSDVTQDDTVTPRALDAEEQAALAALDDDYRYIPPKAETGKIIQKLSNDGVHLYFVYSGSEYDTYTYQGQLKAMFPELVGNERVQEAYISEADHTFILKADREKLINWIQDWFKATVFNRGGSLKAIHKT